MPPVTLCAPAKLNLYLHILDRRADGYHDIESLVVFPSLADGLTLETAETLSLAIDGEFAAEAGGGDGNLVMKAAQALCAETGAAHTAKLTLTKNIPVGAGLGGGSADAAAALRGLNRFWKLGLSKQTLYGIARTLGADVAMCLDSAPLIARGIGDQLMPLLQPLPLVYAVLVHPRTPLLTKDVYAAFEPQTALSSWKDAVSNSGEFLASLANTRNHLQPAAIKVDSVVAEILLTLETLQPAPALVRMTGSGACCFALYTREAEANRAATNITKHYPHWWVKVAQLQR